MKDWNDREIPVACSTGGVLVLSNPFDNLISNGIAPWPPVEIVQKLYQSRHIRAFAGHDLEIATQFLGYYCDLQSIHSEDAITWSVFGTVARSSQNIRNRWLLDFFDSIGMSHGTIEMSEIWLWRRIPHPDTLVPGGPEIDFGIITNEAVLFGEAKWQSKIGTGQGKNGEKNQIQLRTDFLQTFGKRTFPSAKHFGVVYIGLSSSTQHNGVPISDVNVLETTWDVVCAIPSHPLAPELSKYLSWKKNNSSQRQQQSGGY